MRTNFPFAHEKYQTLTGRLISAPNGDAPFDVPRAVAFPVMPSLGQNVFNPSTAKNS